MEARLRQALPFALEEQVAEDLNLLHFAAGRRAPNGEVPAAIVRRQDLDAWLATLRPTDPIYFNDPAAKAFVRIDGPLYQRIVSGALRL